MSKRRKIIDRGDIIEVTGTNDVTYYAQVTWASDYYKDIIQIYFLNSYAIGSNQQKLEYREPSYYTSAKVVRSGRWPKVAQAECGVVPYPPIFVSAGDLWQGDEMLRKANESDISNTQKLKALGANLVEKYAVIT